VVRSLMAHPFASQNAQSNDGTTAETHRARTRNP
jgi:hypothetical protein